MRIDAHQYFWQISRGDYDWLTPELITLYHDFLPEQLNPHLAVCEIDGTVLVHKSCRNRGITRVYVVFSS